MRHLFELDPAVIHSIIHHQAGSIGKALIELMNSVDAGATFVRLAIDKSGFECSDDGQGFARHSDVIRYFGRFGTPHVEGDAKYGRFRLGRGQIMAHATTIWRSNSWQMSVDTLSMGYSYDLEEKRTQLSVLHAAKALCNHQNLIRHLACRGELHPFRSITQTLGVSDP